MRLVYKATQQPVKEGDPVTVNGVRYFIDYFRPPHKPSSEGKVQLCLNGTERHCTEYFVSVIGAEWIEREDRS